MNEISPQAVVSQLCDIESSVRGSRVVVGEFCQIDAFVKIKMAGGKGNIILGRHVYLNSGCVLYCGNGIVIGNDVLIAANCTLAPVNHAFHDVERTIREQGFMESKGGIIIEDDVWIGANSTILDGTVIGRGTVVAAQSLVKGRLDPFSIYAGRPVVKIRSRYADGR